jgi:hypothetical protein
VVELGGLDRSSGGDLSEDMDELQRLVRADETSQETA